MCKSLSTTHHCRAQYEFVITHFRNSRENGNKVWEQGFLGSFGCTSLNYDWSMVFKATIQTKLLFTHIKPKYSCPAN